MAELGGVFGRGEIAQIIVRFIAVSRVIDNYGDIYKEKG